MRAPVDRVNRGGILAAVLLLLLATAGVPASAEQALLEAVANAPSPIDTLDQPDFDGDGIPDASDNCPQSFNPSQANFDGDDKGDSCDDDDDGDGILDDGDHSFNQNDNPCTAGDTTLCDDNCRTTPNAQQLDVDGAPLRSPAPHR